MSNFFTLMATKDHFNDEVFQDLTMVEDAMSKRVHAIIVYDKSNLEIDNSVTLNFQANFAIELIEERLLLTSNKLWPLFSKVLKDLVEKYQSSVVFFDTNIYFEDNRMILRDYFAAQIPVLQGVVDREKSVFISSKSFEGQFSLIQSLKLRDDINKPRIFRVFEYPSIMIIDELLSEEFRNLDSRSLKISPIEEFNSFTF